MRSARRTVSVCTVTLLAFVLAACGSSAPAKAAPTTTTGNTTTTTEATTPTTTPTGSAGSITSVKVKVVDTTDGTVAYRELGSGTPLLLIMGLGGSVDNWAPSFVDDLASRYKVIVFNNAGVGRTTTLATPLTVTEMAAQTSAFISALGLNHVDVLGWSMGGMIAQALAVLHPTQVARLALAATQAGNGHALAVPQAAAEDVTSTNPSVVLSTLFPASAGAAEQQYVSGILSYPGYYEAPRGMLPLQGDAVDGWINGADPAGHEEASIRIPTLVADGTEDALDPVANAQLLQSLIPGAQLVTYPGAGHGFLFQDTSSVVPRLESFFGQ